MPADLDKSSSHAISDGEHDLLDRLLAEDPEHDLNEAHAAADRGVEKLKHALEYAEPAEPAEPVPDPRVIEQAMDRMQIPVEKRAPCVTPNVVRHSPLHASDKPPQIDASSIGAPPPRTADPRPDLPKDPNRRLAARQRERDRDIARQHAHRFKRYRG